MTDLVSAQPQSAGGVRIEYWFSDASPWTWLGSSRFIELARRSREQVEVLPMELTDVFVATAGLPFAERPCVNLY